MSPDRRDAAAAATATPEYGNTYTKADLDAAVAVEREEIAAMLAEMDAGLYGAAIIRIRDRGRGAAPAKLSWEAGNYRGALEICERERDGLRKLVDQLTMSEHRAIKALNQSRGETQLLNAEIERMHVDVLGGLAAAGIATPVEGYRKAKWALSGDIGRLAARTDGLEAALREVQTTMRQESFEWADVAAGVDAALKALGRGGAV